ELLGQAADAGQLVAWIEFAGGDLHPHRVHDLLADRARIAGGDLDHQGTGAGHRAVLSVLCALVQWKRWQVSSVFRRSALPGAGRPYRVMAASSSAAVTGPRKRLATLPSGAIK